MERQSKLQEEQHGMAESLKNLQKKVNEEKTRANEQVSALKMAKANLEGSRQELKDYKEKAGRILQAKDKVIATLREGRHGDDSVGGGVTSAELDEVCQERDAFREDLNQTRFKLEQLKAELQVCRNIVCIPLSFPLFPSRLHSLPLPSIRYPALSFFLFSFFFLSLLCLDL